MDACRKLVDNIKADLKSGNLVVPSLPEVAFRIRGAVNDKHKNAFQIARLIQMDPVLATKIIQVANSAMYRRSKSISDCQAAVCQIGLDVVRNLVTGLAMRQVFGAKNSIIRHSLKKLWRHSCEVAAICYVIGKVTRGIHPDRALLGGLVHDIGALPIYRYAEMYPDVLHQQERLEKMIASISGALGKVVLRAWGMDQELLAIPEQINNHNYQPEQELDYVDVAIVAHVHSNIDTQDPASHTQLDEVASFKKLSISQFGTDASIELVENAKEEINDLVEMMS